MKVICTMMEAMLVELDIRTMTNHGWLTEESYTEPVRRSRRQIHNSTRAVLECDSSLGLPFIAHYRNAFDTSDRLSTRR
jgi:hypothetical protein